MIPLYVPADTIVKCDCGRQLVLCRKELEVLCPALPHTFMVLDWLVEINLERLAKNEFDEIILKTDCPDCQEKVVKKGED
jgi:hypothetical protein